MQSLNQVIRTVRCALISAMHNSISGQLLKGDKRIVGVTNLESIGSDVRGNRDVRLHKLIEPAQQVRDGPVNLFLILDRIRKLGSINT